MLAKEIQAGKVYTAKVSGKLTRVCVEQIVERFGYKGRTQTHYLCTNLATGRTCTVKSCQRFRAAVPS